MARRSRLHVPKPHSRPGEEPDFSYLEASPAGAVRRPEFNARVRDIGYRRLRWCVLDDRTTPGSGIRTDPAELRSGGKLSRSVLTIAQHAALG
jgi:hypothetical protein